jgi:hypothetical protein
VDFNVLDSADASHLESQFLEEEVIVALKQLSSEKAPGPDKYTLGFFQHCWDVVKKDVLNMLHTFQEQGSFE